MMVTDEEAKDLKLWIIKALENISDADSDVLADYVLALIRADAPDPELKANAIENLEDFLRENTAKFVEDIFRTLETKSYLPGYVALPPTIPLPPAIAASSPTSLAVPRGPREGGGKNQGGQPQQQRQQSRKRPYNETVDKSSRGGHDAHYGGHNNERQMKQTRRGGGIGNGSGRGDFHGPGSGRDFDRHNPQQSFLGMQQHGLGGLPGMPATSSGLPFDANDPMAAIMAMQAMGIPMPMPGPGGSPIFPAGYGMLGQNKASVPGRIRPKSRCIDYDTKGVCNRGVNCPFEHDENQVIAGSPQEEYDPKNSSMIDINMDRRPSNGQAQYESFRGRGRGRGRGDRGGSTPRRNNRADFSQAGPNLDRSITTVVVEQIPEESFSEQAVRDFFSQFGTIKEVTMQAYKRLALVKFEDYYSAQTAYESPKVIFDNRFVKVYWYNPNTVPTPTNGKNRPADSATSASSPKPEEPTFDREKFERDAEAAQKRLEERKALQAQNDAKMADLARAKEALFKEQRKLEQKLRARYESLPTEMAVDSDSVAKPTSNGSPAAKPTSSANTDALRAQLKALEDEAKSLGLDPEPWASSPGEGRGRGARGRSWRGSYRGWEGFAGRGHDSARGGVRGRGGPPSFRGALRAGGAYNLDNRPKKVRLTGVGFDSEKDEALKQYLFSIGEFESIEQTTSSTEMDKSSTPTSELLVSFKDRFTAEKFFRGTRDIPGVGKLEFAWVSSPLPPVPVPASPTAAVAGSAAAANIRNGGAKDGRDTIMEDGGEVGFESGHGHGNGIGGEAVEAERDADVEVDYDVAEDDERWVS